MDSEELYLLQDDIELTMRRLRNYRNLLRERGESMSVLSSRNRIENALDGLTEAKHQIHELWQIASLEQGAI